MTYRLHLPDDERQRKALAKRAIDAGREARRRPRLSGPTPSTWSGQRLAEACSELETVEQQWLNGEIGAGPDDHQSDFAVAGLRYTVRIRAARVARDRGTPPWAEPAWHDVDLWDPQPAAHPAPAHPATSHSERSEP